MLKDGDLDNIKMTSANKMKDGIYFGMSDDDYHTLPMPSRSMMEKFLVDPEEAWHNSWMNPDKPERTATPAMELGTAIHTAILEPDVYGELYCSAPKMEDFDGKTILKTNEELGNFLASVGEKKSGKKEDLIARALLYIDPQKTVIWEVVQREFLNEVMESDKRVLDQYQLETIEGIVDSLGRRKGISQIFEKGYAEVTIILTDEDTGIQYKCRLDYVRPETIGELKSFTLKGKKGLYKAICDEIVWNKYNLQFAVYAHTLEAIIKKVRLGEAEVFGEVDQEWLKEFLKVPKKQFFFLFVRTAAPYQMMAIELFKNTGGGTDNVYYSEPMFWLRNSLKQMKVYLDKFGEERWIDQDNVRELEDAHVPGVQYQII